MAAIRNNTFTDTMTYDSPKHFSIWMDPLTSSA